MKKMRMMTLPMKFLLKGLCAIAVFLALPFAHAVDYPYKNVNDFRPLASFKSVEGFEKTIDHYSQHCLDNTGGGTGGIRCFIAYDLWDRELNTCYARLMKVLGAKERKLLKESQLAWVKERDKTIELNYALLGSKEEYSNGTAGALMRAGDADRLMTPIIKQRALLLKEWLEFTASEKGKK